jgi:hypothetical protein
MTTKLSEQINNALMRSYKRAENLDGQLLDDTFVAIPQIDSLLSTSEHHVLYGRRGTGKTHTLRRLERQRRLMGGAALYLDLRTIGSEAGIYGDEEITLPRRATTLLVDVVGAIHEGINELVIVDDQFGARLHELGPALDSLAEAATEVRVQGNVETETAETEGHQVDQHSGVKLDLNPSSPGIAGSVTRTQSQKAESTRRRVERGQERYHIVFGALGSAFKKVAQALSDHGLWLMLDEWSSLPIELQPYLADMLRRTVFTAGIAVKIGAIERRSRFVELRPNGSYVGIELNAEATPLDIDEYMAFDQGASHARAFFSELLFRHAACVITAYDDGPLFDSPDDFIRMTFTDDAFIRFVEGSEGLPRDALQIAQRCASQAVDRQISLSHVNSACTSYFLQSKEGVLSKSALSALGEIVRQCVEMESRVIALRRPIQSHKEVIAELYDQRLIHKRGQGLSLPDSPTGDRYDMFLVDLGCFTDLINRGQLRLVDHGLRDRGIVSTSRDRRDSRSESKGRRTGYALIPTADKWR